MDSASLKLSLLAAARSTLRFLCASLLVTGHLCSAEDWPQWRGPRGDGTWQGPAVKSDWPDALKVRWRRSINPGYSGVVASGRSVITLERRREPASEERILCFDVASGETLWSHSYPADYGDLAYDSGPRASATIANGRVYTLGAVGHVHVLDLETGTVLWQRHLVDDFHGRMPTWGYAAAPRVIDDHVILQPGGDNGWSIVSLSAVTGELIWRSGSDQAGYSWPAIVDRDSRRQLVCWTPSHIRGYDFESGESLWAIPYEVTYGVSIATPIVEGDTVLVSGYWHGTKAIRLGEMASSAQLAWENERDLRGLMSQPLVRDGYVYLLDRRVGVVCFELAGGKILWQTDNALTARDRNPQLNLVWLGDGAAGRCLALNAEGELLLVTLQPTGWQELARRPIIGRTWAHPAFVGTTVIARDDEQIICVELPVASE